MNRNLPPGLRRSSAPAKPTATATRPADAPATPRPKTASVSSAPSSSTTTKPKIVIHIAVPDLNTFRHLQSIGRITAWADHRTPAEVEVRVRVIKDHTDKQTLQIEALLDEVAPGWSYEK